MPRARGFTSASSGFRQSPQQTGTVGTSARAIDADLDFRFAAIAAGTAECRLDGAAGGAAPAGTIPSTRAHGCHEAQRRRRCPRRGPRRAWVSAPTSRARPRGRVCISPARMIASRRAQLRPRAPVHDRRVPIAVHPGRLLRCQAPDGDRVSGRGLHPARSAPRGHRSAARTRRRRDGRGRSRSLRPLARFSALLPALAPRGSRSTTP